LKSAATVPCPPHDTIGQHRGWLENPSWQWNRAAGRGTVDRPIRPNRSWICNAEIPDQFFKSGFSGLAW